MKNGSFLVKKVNITINFNKKGRHVFSPREMMSSFFAVFGEDAGLFSVKLQIWLHLKVMKYSNKKKL